VTIFKIVTLALFISIPVFAYDREPTGLGGFNGWYGTVEKSDKVLFENNYSNTYNEFIVDINAKCYNEGYFEGSSQIARVELDLKITDIKNFLNPEASIPLVIRGLLASYHRSTSWSIDSRTVIFNRVPGERVFTGHLTFYTKSNGGAEFVQVLNKLEVLVPGVNGVNVISFARY
jgi:hypothetical protein